MMPAVRRASLTMLVVLFLPVFAMPSPLGAQTYDSLYIEKVKDTVAAYYKRHPRKLLPEEDRKFKLNPLYGVMYTRETELMAMGGFIGMFKTAADSLLPLSSVGAMALVSTNRSGAAAIIGTWYAPSGKFLASYNARYSNSPRYFWGLGYDAASDPSRRSRLTSERFRTRADFLYRSSGGLLAGGFIGYDYYNARTLSDPSLLAGMPLQTHCLTIGARFEADTRNSKVEPDRGLWFRLEESANFLLGKEGNGVFSRTDVTLDIYLPLWRGGVLAFDFHGDISTSDAPWTMWPQAGGDTRLRGYYQGRYRDRNLIAAQVELRQRVYRSHGVAVWGGAGKVFPSFSDFAVKNTLPTYGAGYRFSFFGIVLRLDAGFGIAGQWALVAGLSHSF